MVMFLLLNLALPAAGTCSQAGEDEPVLCPLRLPAPRTIVVEKNAQQAWREKVQPVSCRSFVVTLAAVGQYLRRARRTDAQSVHYTLPESPCYASGWVRFADGRVAQWRIDQFAIGKLTFKDGKVVILYCPACRSKPFIL